jgi:hypothetical protein
MTGQTLDGNGFPQFSIPFPLVLACSFGPAAAVQSKPLGTLVADFGGAVSKLGLASVAALSGWESAVTAIDADHGPPAGCAVN